MTYAQKTLPINYYYPPVETGGKILGGVGIAIPVVVMLKNGQVDWTNGTDAVMGIVSFVPGVGCIISGAYFIANATVEGSTGKSIGQHRGDVVNRPEVQAGIAAWQATP